MKIDQLRLFCDIIESGSINQAAKQGYITQQGLSRTVMQIETELNTTLFERSNRGMNLTEEGELFYYYAGQMLSLYEQLMEDLHADERTNIYDLYMTKSMYELFGHLNEVPFVKREGLFFSYICKSTDEDVIADINRRKGIALFRGYGLSEDALREKLWPNVRLRRIGTAQKLLYVCHKDHFSGTIEGDDIESALQGKLCCMSSHAYEMKVRPAKIRNAISTPDVNRRKQIMKERDVFSIMPYSMYRMYFEPTEYVILGERNTIMGDCYAAFHSRRNEPTWIEDKLVDYLREMISEEENYEPEAHYKTVL